MDKVYVDSVRLLLASAPAVFRSSGFALKGGTALNLFIRDMPRLSVDLDVVFCDHLAERSRAISDIGERLKIARRELEGLGLSVSIPATSVGDEVKMFIRREKVNVKVEVNFVFRGTILEVEHRKIVQKGRDAFTTDLSLPVLAEAELYGSKLVAAMDRQHPRDLFDVLGMYSAGGLTTEVVECFVSYLAGHNRPIHEVLFSHDRDLAQPFTEEFEGMPAESVTLAELQNVRSRLRRDLSSKLTNRQKSFLSGLARAEPDWSLMQCAHLELLPAIRWKLTNLEKLKKSNPSKFALQSSELEMRWSKAEA